MATRLTRSADRSVTHSRLPWLVVVCACASIASVHCVSASEVAGERVIFADLDADLDKRLSMEEFMRQPGQPDVLRRDFILFDFDEDSSLSRTEFAAVAVDDSGGARGPIPDPFDALVSRAMEAIDESYEQWNQRPQESVNSRQFATNFMKSLSTDDKYSVSGRVLRQADPDFDSLVSRKEALQFLEQQLGVCWLTGPKFRTEFAIAPKITAVRLRDTTGKVVRFAHFLAADENRDGFISEVEFHAHWWDGRSLKEDFRRNDHDGNGVISVAEFARYDGPNFDDPVAWFRTADTNLDARLDKAEMESATIGRRRDLIDSTFSGFDDDGDGKLSLQEYRLSMHANVNNTWSVLPQDRNGDDRISFDEFEFNAWELFHLQRRFYFHRLDSDGDGSLSPTEMTFKKQGRYSLVMMSVDGKQSRNLFTTLSGSMESPDVSPDGKRIAFHRYTAEDRSDSRIHVLGVEDGRQEEICLGMQPTWSADGRQFACTRMVDGKEIWIVDSDGTAEQRISDGWAPQWSPDGKTIAYLKGNSLWTHDVASGRQREVIAAQDHPYEYFWWNGCWSPDSERMILLGVLQGRSEAILVNMQGPAKMHVRWSATVEMGTDFAWAPEGTWIVFPMRNARERRTQWFEIDPDGESPPQVAVELDRDFVPKTGCFSPDGKWYISIFQQ